MFKLHDQLAKDCIQICELSVCQILLMNDSRYPWIIMVPMRENLRDLHHIPEEIQPIAYQEINQISKVLEKIYEPDKLNVAALGNMVPQLHIHVIARYKTDDAWPKPIWGLHNPIKYDEKQLNRTVAALRSEILK